MSNTKKEEELETTLKQRLNEMFDFSGFKSSVRSALALKKHRLIFS